MVHCNCCMGFSLHNFTQIFTNLLLSNTKLLHLVPKPLCTPHLIVPLLLPNLAPISLFYQLIHLHLAHLQQNCFLILKHLQVLFNQSIHFNFSPDNSKNLLKSELLQYCPKNSATAFIFQFSNFNFQNLVASMSDCQTIWHIIQISQKFYFQIIHHYIISTICCNISQCEVKRRSNLFTTHTESHVHIIVPILLYHHHFIITCIYSMVQILHCTNSHLHHTLNNLSVLFKYYCKNKNKTCFKLNVDIVS